MSGMLKAVIALCFVLASTQTIAQSPEKLVIWWEKSLLKAEDDAFVEVTKKFEKKTGVTVELSQFATQDMLPKVIAALDAGDPPDVTYTNVYDLQIAGKWAYEGRLADLSDVLLPIKGIFPPRVLETTYLYNDKLKKKSYYAFPIKMQTMHITYWVDMLETAGFKESDIPTTWKEYWSFWCDKVQPAYRKATGTRVYAIGMPMGVNSSDSYQVFLDFIDAYNVKLVDENGKLTVDDPKVRQGLINAMKDFTDPYLKGCVPPSATNWKDPDNNVAFNNRSTFMTPNGTISVAAKWLNDANNEALSAADRAEAKKRYYENIRTTGFPNKPDGKPMDNRIAVKIGLIFENSKNKKRAKEFASFLLEEGNLRNYVEGGLGRWFPVIKAEQERSFWGEDRHRKAVYSQITGPTLPYEFTKNYKFTILNNENAWAVAANRIVNEKVPVDKAVDELIARIKRTAG